MLALNLGLAFGLELAALAASGVWGAHTGPNVGSRILLGVGTPLAMATVWGLFLSPRAPLPLPPRLAWTAKALVFAAAVGAFAATGRVVWAALYAGCSGLYLTLSLFLPPSDPKRRGPA